MALIIIISTLSCPFATAQNQRAACELQPRSESANHFLVFQPLFSSFLLTGRREDSWWAARRALKSYLCVLSSLQLNVLNLVCRLCFLPQSSFAVVFHML